MKNEQKLAAVLTSRKKADDLAAELANHFDFDELSDMFNVNFTSYPDLARLMIKKSKETNGVEKLVKLLSTKVDEFTLGNVLSAI